MWQRKSLAVVFAAALAGCVSPQTGMQGYYGGGDTNYNQFGATNVSFGYFYDELAPYGVWYNHPRWGDVWHPTRVEADFRPYYRGHWVNTIEYGWTWNSDYPWSDVPFHYGRWVLDPNDGWLWVPGYVWAPAWVIWRSGAVVSVGFRCRLMTGSWLATMSTAQTGIGTGALATVIGTVRALPWNRCWRRGYLSITRALATATITTSLGREANM